MSCDNLYSNGVDVIAFQHRPTEGDKPEDLIACQPATSYTTTLCVDVRVQRPSAELSALSWFFVAFQRRLSRRPTRNAVTMRVRIRIRTATVVVARSVDHVAVGQVEDHARSITLQTRRLAHSSWSLSGWMCRNTHPTGQGHEPLRHRPPPVTRTPSKSYKPVNRCRSTNRCPVAILEGGDELVETAELMPTTIARSVAVVVLRPREAGRHRLRGGVPPRVHPAPGAHRPHRSPRGPAPPRLER